MSGLTMEEVQALRQILGSAWDDPGADWGGFYLLYYDLIKAIPTRGWPASTRWSSTSTATASS